MSEYSWPFMEKHRRIGYARNPDYIAELRALEQFGWHEFIDGLVPVDQSVGSTLKEQLAQLHVRPSIYWYPGSGTDLRPLVLDVPNNAIGRRLFRVSNPDLSEDPIVFWMNDYSRHQADFPRHHREGSRTLLNLLAFRGELVSDYEFLCEQWRGWDRFETELEIAERVERYVFRGLLPVTLFTVNVKNKNQGAHDRPESGDTYLVIYSNVPSHVLFEEAILRMRLHVTCALLSKQGGFAGEIYGFNQYTEIPALLKAFEPELGPVDLYVIDAGGHNYEEKTVGPECIKDYEYVGGPVPIGWSPCRAFGRPGLRYELERKQPEFFNRRGRRRSSYC